MDEGGDKNSAVNSGPIKKYVWIKIMLGIAESFKIPENR